MNRYSVKYFGENLKELRKKKLYTQKRLSKVTLIDQGTISRMESGIVYPNIELLVILANALNTSVGALLKNKDYLPKKERNSDDNVE